MTVNNGLKIRPHVLVLESAWSIDLGDKTTVKPFFDGLGFCEGLRIGYQTYHDSDDLEFWLSEFARSTTNPSVCYIAGHGRKKRLHGIKGKDINLVGVLEKVFPIKRGRRKKVGKKGILIGSCEIGAKKIQKQIINRTNYPLQWVAGYENTVPWIESTVADLLFLKYYFRGKHRKYSDAFLPSGLQKSKCAEKIVKWIREDYFVSKVCGLTATDR